MNIDNSAKEMGLPKLKSFKMTKIYMRFNSNWRVRMHLDLVCPRCNDSASSAERDRARTIYLKMVPSHIFDPLTTSFSEINYLEGKIIKTG